MSQLRELDPSTGAVRRAVALRPDYFGEGIAVLGERIWQLTYRDKSWRSNGTNTASVRCEKS